MSKGMQHLGFNMLGSKNEAFDAKSATKEMRKGK